MKTHALDTSVVVRFLTGEPEPLAKKACERMEAEVVSGNNLMVQDIVVIEAYFALQHYYEVPKKEALAALKALFEQPGIVQEPDGVAHEILKTISASSSKPGFADRIIHARALRDATSLLTFEKASRKLPSVDVL